MINFQHIFTKSMHFTSCLDITTVRTTYTVECVLQCREQTYLFLCNSNVIPSIIMDNAEIGTNLGFKKFL